MAPKAKKTETSSQHKKADQTAATRKASLHNDSLKNSNIQLQVNARECPLHDGDKQLMGFYVQLHSDWFETVSSEPYSEDSFSWVTPSEEQKAQELLTNSTPIRTSWKYGCDIMLDSPEKLQNFNKSPIIFAIIYINGGNEGELKIPVNFLYMDCSPFLTEVCEVSLRSPPICGYTFDVQIKNLRELLPRSQYVLYSPLSLKITSMHNFPMAAEDTTQNYMSNVCIYSKIEFGNGISRILFAVPNHLQASIKKASIDYNICILPGLNDIHTFNESLVSSTFIVEVYDECIIKNIFSPKLISEFNTILRPPPPVEPTVVPTTTTHSKSKNTDKKGATVAAPPPLLPIPLTSTTSIEADKFILDSIMKSIMNNKLSKTHGEARFRLETLLDTAVDKLLQFEKKRSGESITDEDTVTLKEELDVTCVMTKGSNPGRINRLSDLSLFTALAEVNEENKIKGDKILGKSQSMIAKGNEARLKYNQFLDCNTCLRKYQNPDKTMIINGATDLPLPSPYTRMAIVFRYNDDNTLQEIINSVTKVNRLALPDIQVNDNTDIVLYFNAAKLDVVCGFTVIDDDYRLVVLEGLGGGGSRGMTTVFNEIPRTKANDADLKILSNPDVLFPNRMYTVFGPDLKIIRLREKLKKLSRRPELYDRRQASEECFDAIDKLMAIRRAVDLRSTKDFEMYPTHTALNQVELLYGDAVKRSDIDGIAAEERRKELKKVEKERRKETEELLMKSSSYHLSNTSNSNSNNNTHNTLRKFGSSNSMMSDFGFTDSVAPSSALNRDSVTTSTAGAGGADPIRTSSQRRNRTKPNGTGSGTGNNVPLDTRNMAYEEFKKNNTMGRDIIGERLAETMKAKEDAKIRKQEREEEDKAYIKKVLGPAAANADGGKVYVGSGQKLNFIDLAIEQRRKEFSKKKNEVYTYSEQFISQSVPLDAPLLNVKEKEMDAWLTKKGFHYPVSRTYKELVTHPKRPTDARIDDINVPYDGEMRLGRSVTQDPKLASLEAGYDGTKIKGGGQFGILKPPQFTRDFSLSLLGDRSHLPRGTLLPESTEPDEQFWKSVHLGGLHAADAMRDALDEEKRVWRDKCVVDDIHFKVGGFNVRDTPLQVDRTSDILHGTPQSVAMKQLRTMQTSTGKDIHYETAPLTLMNTGPYELKDGPRGSLTRVEDKSKFITTHLPSSGGGTRGGGSAGKDTQLVLDTHGDPLDFVRYIPTDSHVPKREKLIHRRKHTAIDGKN
eukprot:gene2089-4084_t